MANNIENVDRQYQNLWQQLKEEYQSKKVESSQMSKMSKMSKKANDDFYALIFATARSITKNQQQAEDLTQDVICSLLDTQPKEEIMNLYQYVYRAIRNRYINLSKASKRRALREDTFLSIQKIQTIQALELEDDYTETKKHQKQLLFVSLKLKEKEYELLKMLFILSVEDIAEEMNASVKTVQNKKSLLLKKLKTIATFLLVLLVIFIVNSV